jgi:hypothetical protein
VKPSFLRPFLPSFANWIYHQGDFMDQETLSLSKVLCFVDLQLGLILVNDQLDAQFFYLICLFQSSTCFEQPRAHHQENQFYQYNCWYMLLCVSGRLVCRSGRKLPTCIRSSVEELLPVQRVKVATTPLDNLAVSY